MKDSFIFYRSFYEAICGVNEKKQLKLFHAIAKMALNNDEIELKSIEKVIFTLIKPQLEANNKRYLDGCKGGRPKTDGYFSKKPNENENDNVNVNDPVMRAIMED